jgi:hypothetical protein
MPGKYDHKENTTMLKTDLEPSQILRTLPAPKEVEGITAETFESLISNHYEPIVFRQLAKHWDIVQAGNKSPNAVADYLKPFDTGKQLPFVVLPSSAGGRMFYNDTYDGLNFSREDLTLTKALDRLLAEAEVPDAPSLCLQSMIIPEVLPGLEKHLKNPILSSDVAPRAWIGSKISVQPHYDEAASNLAVVVAGKRRFTFFPPEQVSNLYVGRLDFTPAGQPISLVDPRAPDFERFPRFQQALDAALSVELEPGDAIYIPTPWWHHVESLDSHLNMLVNYWWRSTKTPTFMPSTALLLAIQSLRHLPSGERDAWKAMLDYYVFETQGDPAEHLKPHNPGLLGPMNIQLAQHIQKMLLHMLGGKPK